MNKSIVFLRNRYLFLADLAIIAASISIAFVLRLPSEQLPVYVPTALGMIAAALLIKPIVYWRFGLYRRFWAYASMKEVLIIFGAIAANGLLMQGYYLLSFYITKPRVPFTIPAIDALVSLVLVGGMRFSIRMLSEVMQARRRLPGSGATKRVLIAGAGDAGALVAREMQKNPQLRMIPVGFLDDAPEKLNQRIHGVQVLGRLDHVRRIAAEQEADELVIAIPSASGEVFRKISDQCRKGKIPFLTMPGLYELIGGRVSAGRLRNVEVSDLLRRAPAHTADQAVGYALSGKRVMVTGGGGSIGFELCRQIARWGPSEILLLGHGENSIFEALIALGEDYPELALHPVIADIRDRIRMQAVFRAHSPQVVFHAAAHKHVPLMEINVEEAFTNNVLGTRNLVEMGLESATERLVLISSDKAIRPTSVMGATKRLAEMIVQEAALRSGRPYVSVRFGNVLGSRGSVIPVFKRQIARGGPVTVTHPDMERYFMTIPEAVHLVLQAAILGEGGETLLLRMGQPVRIVSLAEDLIRLSGLEPGKDIPIVFTGVRPGEKLSEQLWEEDTMLRPTNHPDILRLVEENHTPEPADLKRRVEELARLADQGEVQKLVRGLNEIVGGTIGQVPPPDMISV
ncbi:MAG: polysaccharide biosynthesis protein [Anaerolineales bacterium]|nr:polysaccharide biosynthesis protein [Anaerolineales bacterium]